MPLSPSRPRYDQFILDLDGCVWIGDEPTPRAVEAIEALREAGKRVAYATNDPRSATEDYVARLWKIGIRASLARRGDRGRRAPAPARRDALRPHRLRDRHRARCAATWPTPG